MRAPTRRMMAQTPGQGSPDYLACRQGTGTREAKSCYASRHAASTQVGEDVLRHFERDIAAHVHFADDVRQARSIAEAVNDVLEDSLLPLELAEIAKDPLPKGLPMLARRASLLSRSAPGLPGRMGLRWPGLGPGGAPVPEAPAFLMLLPPAQRPAPQLVGTPDHEREDDEDGELGQTQGAGPEDHLQRWQVDHGGREGQLEQNPPEKQAVGEDPDLAQRGAAGAGGEGCADLAGGDPGEGHGRGGEVGTVQGALWAGGVAR